LVGAGLGAAAGATFLNPVTPAAGAILAALSAHHLPG